MPIIATTAPNAAFSVRAAGSPDLESWQSFVDASPDAGPLHHAAWYDILRDAYSVEPFFFLANDGSGAIRGIMPMYLSRSRFTGTHYTTLEGGILANDAGAAGALLATARQLRDEPRVQYVQLRGGALVEEFPIGIPTVHTIVRTDDGVGAALARIKAKTRWGIRQAEKQDLEVRLDPNFRDLGSFYRLYAAHMHELGTPTFGPATFRAMREHLGRERLRLYLLRYRGTPIGGMMCIVHGNRWTDLYAIVRRSAELEFANYFLYWQVIRDAAECGVSEFDLGRSTPNSSVHLFKRKWGGRDVTVRYGFSPAANNRSQRFGLLGETREKGWRQRLWTRLPLSLCNWAGPVIRRDLPFL